MLSLSKKISKYFPNFCGIKSFHTAVLDGNNASGYVAYALSDIGFGYPITPSSPGLDVYTKLSDNKVVNAFGAIPKLKIMQSEAGVAGALHGGSDQGALATTFTSSQGLMLMIPVLFKMSNSGMPSVIHVASRTMVRQVGTIFGDHSDVMTIRGCGWPLIASGSVQEAHDLGIASHLVTMKSKLPVVHFYDGIRTSHEFQSVEIADISDIQKLITPNMLDDLRSTSLAPARGLFRNIATNADTQMQWIEAANVHYKQFPDEFEKVLNRIHRCIGRSYSCFDYIGHPEAQYLIVMMGSGAETVDEYINYQIKNENEKFGLIKVRLYRPFSVDKFIKTIPSSVKKIAVLDKTREYGSEAGQPLFLDVSGALSSAGDTRKVINGVYGLGGKDFTPSMVDAVFENLKKNDPKMKFTVGVNDDILHSSLTVDKKVDTCPSDTVQALLFGIGGDGTIGASQDALNIISEYAKLSVQGYFYFEAKKTGGYTISNLRFGKQQIKSAYEIQNADYVACHQVSLLKKFPLLDKIKENGIFVINCSATNFEELDSLLPESTKKIIASRKIKVFCIDATMKAIEIGTHVNMLMQSVFFNLLISRLIPFETAISHLKTSVEKSFAKKGPSVIAKNIIGLESGVENLKQLDIDYDKWNKYSSLPRNFEKENGFMQNLILPVMYNQGESVPLSSFLKYSSAKTPLGTSKYEKRGLAAYVPTWNPTLCNTCNLCSLFCPHSCIRPALLHKEEVDASPVQLPHKSLTNYKYSLAISPEDCMGCNICSNVCVPKALKMVPFSEANVKTMSQQFEYVSNIEKRSDTPRLNVRTSQFLEPLLEFPGSCAGCAQTQYTKLLTQLFGSRMNICNATGCSIIWGGMFPSIPYTTNKHGFGPAWANSLFEDNAEYTYGMFITYHEKRKRLFEFIKETLKSNDFPLNNDIRQLLGDWLVKKDDPNSSVELAVSIKKYLEKEIEVQKEFGSSKAINLINELLSKIDLFSKTSFWGIGGDGWAYDIGFSGLDHVMASKSNDVNFFVFDNEFYANTGYQVSKSTPHGASVVFQRTGKNDHKKELAMMMMTYDHTYVASIALGANPTHALKALIDADSYNGPSLVVAYSPCMGHNIKGSLANQISQQRKAVASGYWPLFVRDPRKGKESISYQAKNDIPLSEFLDGEPRFSKKDFRDEMQRYISRRVRKLNLQKKETVDDRSDTVNLSSLPFC